MAPTSTAGRSRGLISIDPGLNSLGWAYWLPARADRIRLEGEDVPPTRAGLIKAPRKLELPDRCKWIAEALVREVEPFNPKQWDVVSEFPEWMNIQLGWAAGDLQKLVFLVGHLSGHLRTCASFTIVKPSEWKGQLPKKVVIQRLTKRFGPGATREWEDDMWDAIGIGMWKLGRF